MRKELTLSSIKSELGKYISPTIYCHPDVYCEIEKIIAPPASIYQPFVFDYGMKIVKDPHLPKYFRQWKFPEDEFVEYEKSDESWAIPIGFGYYADTDDFAIFVIDDYKFSYNYSFSSWKPFQNLIVTNV